MRIITMLTRKSHKEVEEQREIYKTDDKGKVYESTNVSEIRRKEDLPILLQW